MTYYLPSFHVRMMNRLSIVVSFWLLAVQWLLVASSAAVESVEAIPHVGKWDAFEVSLENPRSYDSPFKDVELAVAFRKPDGSEIEFWGFYDGRNRWKIRLMPDQLGRWSYQARFSDGAAGVEGAFECVESDLPGMISRESENPLWFGFEGGEHVVIRSFHVGDRFFAGGPNNLTGEKWSPAMRASFLDWAQAQGYNTLSIASHYLNRDSKGRGAGWDTPDLWDVRKQEPNPEEYAKMEAILDNLRNRRFMVYPFAGLFGKGSDYPQAREDQRRYIKYTLARVGAYWNVLLMVGGPEPRQRKMQYLSQEEVNRLGREIASLDVYGHLISVHNPPGPDEFMDEEWTNYGILQGPKTTDRQKLYQGLLESHHPSKPLYAQETLWPGNRIGHPDYSREDIRKNGYVMMMAATAINFADMDGNSSSGFSGSMDLSKKVQYKHDIIRAVWDFFESVDYYRMKPSPELVSRGYCLADSGRQYLVYLEENSPTDVSLQEGNYVITWINAQDTAVRTSGGTTRDGRRLTPPEGGDDWLLMLERISEGRD